MIVVSKLHCNGLGVIVIRVMPLVLLFVLLDPLCDGKLGPFPILAHIVILFEVDRALEEVEGCLFFALLGLVRPEVFYFSINSALLELEEASLSIVLDLGEIVKLSLLLVHYLAGLVLELFEHFRVVFLTLRLVIAKLQLHASCVVSILLDPLI